MVGGCIALLEGGDADAELVLALGGPPARWVTGDDGGPDYWLRVWAARGLLWAWDDVALPAIRGALNDEAWRVREMAVKVIRRHQLGDVVSQVAALRQDPNHRVRAAADRAVEQLTAAGA